MLEFKFFNQQIRTKKRTLFTWLIIWCLLLLLFASVFDSLSQSAAETAKVYETLPKGVFKSINISPENYLTRIENFLSGQFLFVYILAGSIFSYSLGVGAIGRKIENRTIAGFLTKPISRFRIYQLMLASNAVLLTVASTILGLYAYFIFKISLHHQSYISPYYFLWLFVGTTLVFLSVAALGQMIGTLLNGGKALQVGAALIVASWFVSTLGDLAHIPSLLQHLSIFYYFDISTLRDQFGVNWSRSIWLIILFPLLALLGGVIFKKKNIYL